MINSTPSRVAMSAAFLIMTLLFSVDSARAQSHTLQVTMPFDFYVGDTLLPAGDYEAVVIVNNVVRFHNQGTNTSAAFQTQPLNKVSGVLSSPVLIFNTYGQDHFLSEMWWGNGSVGSMLMTSKRETELAKAVQPIRTEARARR